MISSAEIHICIRGTCMIALHESSKMEEHGKEHISFHKFACVFLFQLMRKREEYTVSFVHIFITPLPTGACDYSSTLVIVHRCLLYTVYRSKTISRYYKVECTFYVRAELSCLSASSSGFTPCMPGFLTQDCHYPSIHPLCRIPYRALLFTCLIKTG